MAQPLPASLLSADAAVLLVLLPAGRPGGQAGAERATNMLLLSGLQDLLGSAIRVLAVDELSHPSVVRSFHPADLPACVLMRQGTELWRQPGLPEGPATAALLLSKLQLPVATAEVD